MISHHLYEGRVTSHHRLARKLIVHVPLRVPCFLSLTVCTEVSENPRLCIRLTPQSVQNVLLFRPLCRFFFCDRFSRSLYVRSLLPYSATHCIYVTGTDKPSSLFSAFHRHHRHLATCDFGAFHCDTLSADAHLVTMPLSPTMVNNVAVSAHQSERCALLKAYAVLTEYKTYLLNVRRRPAYLTGLRPHFYDACTHTPKYHTLYPRSIVTSPLYLSGVPCCPRGLLVHAVCRVGATDSRASLVRFAFSASASPEYG